MPFHGMVYTTEQSIGKQITPPAKAGGVKYVPQVDINL
jgi:hypothetical protein